MPIPVGGALNTNVPTVPFFIILCKPPFGIDFALHMGVYHRLQEQSRKGSEILLPTFRSKQ
jgi:ABC-type uncharacterized transport system ATPase subunit